MAGTGGPGGLSEQQIQQGRQWWFEQYEEPEAEQQARMEAQREAEMAEEAGYRFVRFSCLAFILGIACGLAGIAYALSMILDSSIASSLLHG